MRVLVTRPEADAGELAARLTGLGHTVLLDPLLDIEFVSLDPRHFEGVGAIIATSRNALRSLAASEALPRAIGLPIHVVGPGTEAAARGVGFTKVLKGPGTARELAATLDPAAIASGRPLLYLAGESLAFDLASALEARGFAVRQVTAYRSVAAKTLRAETIAQFEDRRIDAVIVMSPRTAEVYGHLIAGAGLIDAARGIPHHCLSGNVATALAPLAPINVKIADRPSLEELLALLPA